MSGFWIPAGALKSQTSAQGMRLHTPEESASHFRSALKVSATSQAGASHHMACTKCRLLLFQIQISGVLLASARYSLIMLVGSGLMASEELRPALPWWPERMRAAPFGQLCDIFRGITDAV